MFDAKEQTAITRFDHSRLLQERAHRLIPGGAHTYAKGDDQYPRLSPGFIARGKGCRVWDVDGNEFIEYGSGLRSVTLGHAFEPVVDAACRQMTLGNNYNRPAPIEVECAERLLSLVDAEQVKFAKDGSAVTTAAIKLARAFTGREKVAYCRDHPFFSYNDWFIATTAVDSGVFSGSRGIGLPFAYNDLAGLSRLFEEHPQEIACVIMEPSRTEEPVEGYLQGVAKLARANDALFILDEMITGFRYHLNGAQRLYGVRPDLSAFGKAMANGFSVSALAGRREVMDLGGLSHDSERVFLLSTTHGAENHALAAAIATMEYYEEHDVVGILHRQGRRLRLGVEQVVRDIGADAHFAVGGRDCNLHFQTYDADGKPSQPFRTLFMQEMIRNGILAPSFVVSAAHSDVDIDETIAAVAASLRVYVRAIEEGLDRFLVGPPVQPVYRKYNRAPQ